MKTIELTIDSVRKYKTSIISMLRQSFEKSFPGKKNNTYDLEKRVSSLETYIKEKKAIVYGVIREEELIGIIWFFEKDNQTIHINHFVVDEGYRGLGVGKSLWNQIENYANKNEIPDIELFVTKENESAVNFYKNREFKVERLLMKKRVFK